ncbi:MAG: hypothetical protein PXX77_01505 [Gallionella sp.]|nr:hypothetical protein [Gallionella sp.]
MARTKRLPLHFTVEIVTMPLNDISKHGSFNQSTLPRVRMILVGEASGHYLAGLKCAHEQDSPIVNWNNKDILYLNADGALEMYAEEDGRSRSGPVMDGWKACEQALNNQDETIKAFKEAEPEINRFIHGCDCLLLVVTLDNPMAFVAGEGIANIANEAGVMSVAVIGTPYIREAVEDAKVWHCNPASSAANQAVIERMAAICHCSIPDEGFWSRSGEEQDWSWMFYQSTMALCLFSKMATRKDCYVQIGDAIATSGVCMVGCNYSEFEHPKAAIEDALGESSRWIECDGQRASGAIFHIIGNVEKVEQMKRGVLLALEEPSKILRNDKPFWASDASFHIVTSTPEYMREEDFCFIQVLSMGVVEI